MQIGVKDATKAVNIEGDACLHYEKVFWHSILLVNWVEANTVVTMITN